MRFLELPDLGLDSFWPACVSWPLSMLPAPTSRSLASSKRHWHYLSSHFALLDGRSGKRPRLSVQRKPISLAGAVRRISMRRKRRNELKDKIGECSNGISSSAFTNILVSGTFCVEPNCFWSWGGRFVVYISYLA